MIFFNNFSGSRVGNALTYSLIDHEIGSSEKDWFDYYYDMLAENYEKFDADPLAFWKESKMLGEQVPNTTPSHPLGDYCGIYRKRGYDPITVEIRDGVLYVVCWDSVIPLQHYHYDTFIVAAYGCALDYGHPAVFTADEADGSISQLKLRLNQETDAVPVCFTKD